MRSSDWLSSPQGWLSPPGARRLFFVVPTMVAFRGPVLQTADHQLAVTLLSGVLAGVAWQLVARRDLADRLTFSAAVVLVCGGLLLALGDKGGLESEQTVGLSLAGIVTGLVFTEQWIRIRGSRLVAARKQTAYEERKTSA